MMVSRLCYRQIRFVHEGIWAKDMNKVLNEAKNPKFFTGDYEDCRSHVVQIGDPCLRKKALEVPVRDIKTEDFSKLIKKIHTAMDKYLAMGISAPQLGIPIRVIGVQFTEENLYGYKKEEIEELGIKVFPRTILINPEMIVVDKTELTHREGSCSIFGYNAMVPRFKSICVKAYDEKAEPITLTFHNWSARIVQQGIDHLNGELYIDKMKPKTLEFDYWDRVNYQDGQFTLDLSPLSKMKRFFSYIYYYPLRWKKN